MKKVSIGQKVKSPINTGGTAVGTSPVALSANTTPLQGGVQVTAAVANTSQVYVGARPTLTAGSDNDTDGFQLAAGASVFVPAAQLADVYVIAGAVSQQVYWLAH